MIELYQFDFSPYCIKIRAVLNVKDIPYRTIEIIPLTTQYKVKKLTGQSKVPALKDGSTVLTDSSEIAIYLDTAWPEPRLIPEEPELFRECYLWEDWADEVLVKLIRPLAFSAVLDDPRLGQEQLPPFGNLALDTIMPYMVPLATRGLIHRYGITKREIRDARPHLLRSLDMLTGAVVASDYLVGDALTMADISVASACKNIDTVPDVRGLPQYATFFAWRDRILAECFVS